MRKFFLTALLVATLSATTAFAAADEGLTLGAADKTVSAKSIVSVMSLHLRQSMEVEIIAEGADAQQAAEALRDLINAGIN